MRSRQVHNELKSNADGVKIDTDDDNFTHMQNRPPLKGRNSKVCMWGEVPNVITAVSNVDRFRGF